MAQTATMGPPLSPRETRRSGRRSAPSVSASKSPDSDLPAPRSAKDPSSRTVSSAPASTASRHRRLKQEDDTDAPDAHRPPQPPSVASSNSTNGAGGKKQRKPKDRIPASAHSPDPDVPDTEDATPDDEEQGITRCVCGSAEDDPDAGEFMVQCETCKVWQHGLCMGYQSEDQVHDDDYYCEECRPELHVELLKKISKQRQRQTSASSRAEHASGSRVSRSHSPSHLNKQSKRRNTMNSRDAAYDESLKQVMQVSALEAAGHDEHSPPADPAASTSDSNKKKRKRSDDEGNQKKRTRSASTASDQPPAPLPPPDPPVSSAPAPKPAPRKQRGGRKAHQTDPTPAQDEEPQSASHGLKHKSTTARTKALGAPKRPPLSHTLSSNADHGARRNQSGGQQSASVSQQHLYTSWGLPDYLAHLAEMLPTDVPQPLEISHAGAAGSRGQSAERTMERGVKVKWPSKRTSVGDMNKRVRALVEWVGREQASALDRSRRRESLEKAIREQKRSESLQGSSSEPIPVDGDDPNPDELLLDNAAEMAGATMKLMEELMEELIGFQERFGPGAKIRDKKAVS